MASLRQDACAMAVPLPMPSGRPVRRGNSRCRPRPRVPMNCPPGPGVHGENGPFRLETPPTPPHNDSSMQHHWVVPLVAAVADSVICALVLRGGLRRAITRTFAWMTLCMVLWNLDIFALYYFPEAEDAELWSRLFRTGMCFAPAALLHASLIQSESETKGWRRVLALSYGVAFALAIANLHGELVSGVRRHVWGWYIEPTRLYALMTVLIAADVPLALHPVWHARRYPPPPRQHGTARRCLLAAI